MELLLNLLWLMIALGALVICWRAQLRLGTAKTVPRSRVLVLAACLSALAFPIVSASDDLVALRPEAEESSSINCCVKKSKPTLSPTWGNDAPPMSEAVRICSVKPAIEPKRLVFLRPAVFPEQASVTILGCRAPPRPESSCFDCAGGNCAISELGLSATTLANHRLESPDGSRRRLMCRRMGEWSVKWKMHTLRASAGLSAAPQDLEESSQASLHVG
jgi:hypothetical protein